MPKPASDTPTAATASGVNQIVDWLAWPPGDSSAEDLDTIRHYLGLLRQDPPPAAQLHALLDRLYERGLVAANSLIPRLYHVRLPISPLTRRTARAIQDVFELCARAYLDTAETLPEASGKVLSSSLQIRIWRAVHALGRHLFVADLISAPATPGIWQQLHLTVRTASRLGIDLDVPIAEDSSIMQLYRRSLLLGCAQSSAFTAHEWNCIDAYTANHAALLRFVDAAKAGEPQSGFWLNPDDDTGPLAATRRPPAANPVLIHFSCAALLALIDDHRTRLGKEARPEAMGFPADLPTRLARALLTRLRTVWGDTRKRRFPRRRQGYRARLCFGFKEIWNLLHDKVVAEDEPSEWMITNESPDGYAVMHVAGKPHKVQIGDLIALRSDDTVEWQICIVRWALSENPEHLELGLQVLAPRASPATLALPDALQTARQPVLLMPAVPPLHERQSLATVPGLLIEDSGKLVLLVETGKVEVREIKIAAVEEQSSDIDVFSIDPDRSG